MKKILLYGFDAADVRALESDRLFQMFGPAEFERIDPTSQLNHDELCKALKPEAVLLPRNGLGAHLNNATMAACRHIRFVYPGCEIEHVSRVLTETRKLRFQAAA